MGFRKLPDKVVIINEEELIRELEYKLSSEELRVVYPEKTIRTLSKSSLKTLMKEDNILELDNAHIEEGTEGFYVK
jgi:hypothetical protein